MQSNFYKLNQDGTASVGAGTIIPEGFIEYTSGNEPQELVDALALEASNQELQAKISEAKTYLANTDYKMLPNYVVKPEEDINDIITKRNTAREFIRSQG